MIKEVFKKVLTVLGLGGVLSALSLSENETVATVCDPNSVDGGCAPKLYENEGFPFSFIKDHEETINSGKVFLENQFDLAPALANLIFWAIVAAIVLKFLSWAFEKFSMIIFVVIVLVIGASYFGLLQAV